MFPLIPKALLTKSSDNREIGGIIDKFRNRLQEIPFLHGQEVTADVGTTATEIRHNLGRPWQGYLVLRQNANAILWAPASPSNISLTLQSSAAVSVKLWIF